MLPSFHPPTVKHFWGVLFCFVSHVCSHSQFRRHLATIALLLPAGCVSFAQNLIAPIHFWYKLFRHVKQKSKSFWLIPRLQTVQYLNTICTQVFLPCFFVIQQKKKKRHLICQIQINSGSTNETITTGSERKMGPQPSTTQYNVIGVI